MKVLKESKNKKEKLNWKYNYKIKKKRKSRENQRMINKASLLKIHIQLISYTQIRDSG
jgi:hypothetical protein